MQQEVSNENTPQKQDSQNSQQETNGAKENTTQSRSYRDGRANAKKKKLRTPRSTSNPSETAVEPVSKSDPSGKVPVGSQLGWLLVEGVGRREVIAERDCY